MRPSLEVRVSSDGPRVCIAARGELDLATIDLVRDELVRRWSPGTELELDLSGLTFIDSSGLRLLIEADELAKANGHSFLLANPSAPVLRILEIAGLLDSSEIPIRQESVAGT